MGEPERADHLAIEEIADYLEGKLGEERSAAVREHLGRCAPCRLEAKRLERFSRIDADADLARGAEWLYARGKLEKAYKERIAPPDPRVIRHHERRALAWLMPIAATVAAILLVARFAAREERPAGPGAGDALRGAPPVQYGIVLRRPLGELAAAPDTFAWTSERADESFTLEIFSPSLERVYAAAGIAGPSFAAPDSLGGILRPNVTYLWTVKGTRGLERPATSPNGWFTFRR